ncbi:MAG: DUF4391 domain-containing protein [Fusobacteriaceae bacterium]
MEFRKSGNEEKIAKILHELVPKATLIEIKFGESFKISTAMKNIKDNSLKINYLETTDWFKISENNEFMDSLNSMTFNTTNLKTFYESIVDRVKANKVLKTIGIFSLEDVDENNKKAENIIFVQKEIENLKKELKNEKHTFKRAEIVKKIKELNNKLK